ncbi:MAG: glycoside hydrolase family 3 N-terminal domain-containing protein [Candidatus Cryptobacteroides sp.]
MDSNVPSCLKNEVSYLDCGDYVIVNQSKGARLGYSPTSGVELLFEDGLAFKDLNRNGSLDAYEDWRLPVRERAANLASQMSLEQICGLMLYSSAVDVFSEELTGKQLEYLERDNIRHLLVRDVADPGTAARWANSVQRWCEGAPLGIPANNSTDPRNYTNGSANVNNYKPEPDGEFNPAQSSNISKWPREMGLGATFDLDIIRRHGEIVSAEYRAMGIVTALSPQADMASEPRWRRFYGTFSEDPVLLADMVRTYCDAFQTTSSSKTGWGDESVNCMVKHWPGGGNGEAGRDAHFGIGKYAVYPGDNLEGGMIPFIDGAFRLKGKTSMASAVMPYYTIPFGQDPSGENVGNGFSRYVVQDLLRDKCRYEGVVCTDWGIVNSNKVPWARISKATGTPWGMEEFTPAERRLKCFEAGVDQLGGAKDNSISIEAYHLWEEKYGEQSARERFELSARRLLVNIFNVGLFENPYVDASRAEAIVGCRDFVSAGYDAQLKSVVMLKNVGGALPKTGRLKVYEPLRRVPAGLTHWMKPTEPYEEYPISKELLGQYFDVADSPQEADFALVCIKSPVGHWGYRQNPDLEKEGEYLPISLQWSPYTAEFARECSIAGGDPLEVSSNRSYKGRTETTSNEPDMYLVRETKAAMGDKPVVVYVATERPFVPADIEPWADAILIGFGVCNNAVLDIVSGAAEPYGLLPCQFPADMRTVEEQYEDVPRDMRPYVDAAGNSYDFAFGLDWNGVIRDCRVKKYY